MASDWDEAMNSERELAVLRADLRRAVEDRAKLLVVMDAIYNLAWEGMNSTFIDGIMLNGYSRFGAICDEVAQVKAIVGGTP